MIADLLLEKLALLAREYDFERYFAAVAEGARVLVDGDGAALIVRDGDYQRYQFFYGLPDAYREYGHYAFAGGQGTSGAAIQGNAPVFAEDYPASPWAMPEFVALGLQGSLALPVHGPELRPLGALVVSWFHRHPDALMPEQIEAVTVLADMLGMAWHRMTLERDLEALVQTDSLTGVYNRHRLSERVAAACSRALRQERLLGVVLIDIDGFKDVNDALGHHAGDRLLREVVGRLRDVLRPEDTIIRYAGDEFVLLIEDLRRAGDLDTILHRVRLALGIRMRSEGRSVRVTASLGAVTYPEQDGDPTLLLQYADQALYRAKSAGGDHIRHHDLAMDQRMERTRYLRGELGRALEESELCLYWQPIIALGDGRCVGAEALLRWQHPELGFLLPGDFMAALEESAAAREVGRWVLRAACRAAVAWRREGFDLDVHINLSAREMENHQLCEEIRRGLDEFPEMPPERICLEIVERVALRDLTMTRQLIADCRSMGVRFALDDFGTGSAALQYLLELECDQVKIDHSFVIPMLDSPRHRKMVQGIIQMSHALGVTVTAEGVEQDAILDLLGELGADQAQGFDIGRPMECQGFLRWLRARAEAREVLGI